MKLSIEPTDEHYRLANGDYAQLWSGRDHKGRLVTVAVSAVFISAVEMTSQGEVDREIREAAALNGKRARVNLGL